MWRALHWPRTISSSNSDIRYYETVCDDGIRWINSKNYKKASYLKYDFLSVRATGSHSTVVRWLFWCATALCNRLIGGHSKRCPQYLNLKYLSNLRLLFDYYLNILYPPCGNGSCSFLLESVIVPCMNIQIQIQYARSLSETLKVSKNICSTKMKCPT